MKFAELIKRYARAGHGNVVTDVNTAVAANTGAADDGSTQHATSKRTTRIVQRDGDTEVFTSETSERRSS